MSNEERSAEIQKLRERINFAIEQFEDATGCKAEARLEVYDQDNTYVAN